MAKDFAELSYWATFAGSQLQTNFDETDEWICEPLIHTTLSSREARACLEIAGYVANKGARLSELLLKLAKTNNTQQEAYYLTQLRRFLDVDIREEL